MFGKKKADPFEELAARAWRPGMPLSTDRVRALLAHLGNPERGLRVAHVGGTNGKGSVVAMMDAALREAGHKVGRFTSPPVVRYADQVQVDGRDVPEKVARRFLDEVRPWVEKQEAPPTGFELLVALALDWFAREGVDVALVEVGMGGARDATNVFERPLVTVVTNVTNDHLDVIGPTLADAAREKAAIARAGVPFVTGAAGETLAPLLDEAERRGASPVRVLGADFEAFTLEGTLEAQRFSVSGLERAYPEELTVALPGEHQAENAALALAALEALDAAGVAVPVDACARGLASVEWPGRLTYLPGKPAVIIDGAHNPAAVEALVEFLRENELKPTIVFGCLEDKPWQDMVMALARTANGAVCTLPPHPRALHPTESARAFAWFGTFGTVVEDPVRAFNTALGQAGEDGVVLVTGSLYLTAAVLRALGAEA